MIEGKIRISFENDDRDEVGIGIGIGEEGFHRFAVIIRIVKKIEEKRSGIFRAGEKVNFGTVRTGNYRAASGQTADEGNEPLVIGAFCRVTRRFSARGKLRGTVSKSGW